MNKRTFTEFCRLVYEKAGITLNDGKEALVSSRIGKRLRELEIDSPEEYLEILKNDKSGDEIVKMLDYISTNVTSFFRESDHFDFMRKHLEQCKQAGQTRFRFWSAASSSGEEPYTMTMIIAESLGLNCDARILATDISTRILEKAMAGTYPENKIDGIPRALLDKYFTKSGEPGAVEYTAIDRIKKMVAFRRLNLSTPPFPIKGPLDIVFCRNVMIYFDNLVRSRLVEEIYRVLKPGGYLFVGHAESLSSLKTSFRTVKPAVYQK